ncbi:MAG: SDR family oxidoreductase [bacterium]
MEATTRMLEGKVGIVTGAGRGIGREIARMMAREGAAVVVNDVGAAADGSSTGERPADEVVAAITKERGQAVANFDSVASWDGAHAMVAQAVDRFGRLDFVVNNAGILRDVIFHKMTEADWDAVIAVHLKGTFNVSRAAAERFRAQGGGAIVNFTSTSGLIGNYGQSNYAAAKLGIVGLTRSIALDMARFQVRCNAVAPFAWTRLTATIPEGRTDAEKRRVENLKKMKPEQIAPLVVFLASDAAQEVNGQIFCVRGGEIVLFSVPRPIRAIHKEGGWTPQTIAEVVPAAFRASFVPNQVSADVFPYEPLF